MKIRYSLFLLIFLLTACGTTSKSIKLSTPSHSSSVDVYEPTDAKKAKPDIAFIVLHPKGGNGNSHSGVTSLGSSLSEAGYTVYAPDMPWAPYTATLTEAFQIIDKLVATAAKQHKKVFITGHSIGAAVAYLYCSAYENTHKNVAGVVLTAPGHLLQVSNRIQEATARDVQRARKLVKQGRGDEKNSFSDYNQGSKTSISTTARIYLSWFDPREFPNPTTNLDTLKVPILWIDGDADKAAARMGFENLYIRINEYTRYPQNRYVEVSADHFGVPNVADETITTWVKSF